jgi:Flp pilus assembly pilin Flp
LIVWNFSEFFSKMIMLRRFIHDNSAAASIEYAMIAVFIAVGIIALVNGLGVKLKGFFTSLQGSF